METTSVKCTVIKDKCYWEEVSKVRRGYYRLQGQYVFQNTRTGEFAIATGYSNTDRFKRGKEFLRRQAIDYAMGRVEALFPGEWVLEEILEEVYLLW